MRSGLRFRALAVLVVFLAALSAIGEETKSRGTWRAIRAVSPPIIDGDLTDAAWQNAPEITGFTQRDPDDGKPATQKTIVKVVYDDNAIYFGARLEDSKPPTAILGRRDNNLESDWFRIYIDAQLDRLSGASFWVNPANVQVDMILYNDIYDDWSWDAVWASRARIVPGGWVAEVRIPYSQIRFSEKSVHTWGINFARRIATNKEVNWLVNTPRGEQGRVSRFADLIGIEGIKPDKAFELMPYGVTRADIITRGNRENPFLETRSSRFDGGLDLKYGLTSGLTLTGTLNPDFGQVEVDPAVVNLSQFETFFPEKRPFFTEGAQMFRFGSGPAYGRWGFNFTSPTFFYSRRIGRTPQGTGGVSADFSDAPGETTILGAAKLSGKFGKGWSVGVMDALTDEEVGTFSRSRIDLTSGQRVTSRWSQSVEPRTNYLVSRLAKEYGKSSRIGVLLTAVNRSVPTELSSLREAAYVGGVDGHTLFKQKSWLFEWLAIGSSVQGSERAITLTQRNAARYYHRPDAGHVELDPSRTSLTGWGGKAMVAKQTGKWRPNLMVQSYSPGFEVNDVGFLPRTDITTTQAVIHYINEDPIMKLRERSFWVGRFQNYNYDGNRIADGIAGNGFLEFKNNWYTFAWFGAARERFDDRSTRGGPLMKRGPNHYYGGGGGSDSQKKLWFEAWVESWQAEDSSYSRTWWITTRFRPMTGLSLSVTPQFRRGREFAQYVSTIPDPAATQTYGAHYVFAELEQRTLDLATRVDWTVNARLSFQLFVQPFIASGHYHSFKELARPSTREYIPAAAPFNPDFTLRSVKGSAVVRWEFRPGSALYVVWNENRGRPDDLGDFRLRRDLSAIPSLPSQDVFLVKVSYYLPL